MRYDHWRYVQKCPQAVEHARTYESKPEDLDFERVGGGVICEACNHEYYDHPRHPHWPCLTITCDGRVVKL